MADNFMGPGLTLDDVYPVGSIYMSANATDPANRFGGTWQRIQERFLLAAGSTHAAGSTGGEFEHTISFDEMPTHQHLQRVVTTDGKLNSYVSAATAGSSNGGGVANASWQTGKLEVTTGSAGRGQAMSITPPYLAVYMWQRTA